VITFDPLSQYRPEAGELVIHDPQVLKGLLRDRGKSQPFRVLYQPRSGEVIDHWRKVGILAYARGNLLLCIDEMGMLCENGQFMQDAKGREPILKSLVHYGRHRQIDMICTAQRPTDIARRYTALCSEIRIFQTDEPKDLTYLQERVGELAANQLPQLGKFCQLRWNDQGATVHRRKLSR
jgi:hypothetical protein